MSTVGESRTELVTGRENIPVRVESPGVLADAGGGNPGNGFTGPGVVPLSVGLAICSLSGGATESIKASPNPTELFLKGLQSQVKAGHLPLVCVSLLCVPPLPASSLCPPSPPTSASLGVKAPCESRASLYSVL